MPRASEISRQYHAALSASHSQYDAMYLERCEATGLYVKFFGRLTCDFGTRFREERFRARLQEQIERVAGTRNLHSIAIDGTYRHGVFSDLVLVAEVARAPDQPIELGRVAGHVGVPEDGLKRGADYLVGRDVLANSRIGKPEYSPRVRVDEELLNQTLKFKKGQSLLMSHDATGVAAVPMPIKARNANERLSEWLRHRYGRSR